MRAAVLTLALLLPGCMFSEYDNGCPDKITVHTVYVSLALGGAWDVALIQQSLNRSMAWSDVGLDHAVGGTRPDGDPGGVVVTIIPTNGTATGNETAMAAMTFDWRRCISADHQEAALDSQRELHADEWADWIRPFAAETGLAPVAPEEWRLSPPIWMAELSG